MRRRGLGEKGFIHLCAFSKTAIGGTIFSHKYIHKLRGFHRITLQRIRWNALVLIKSSKDK